MSDLPRGKPSIKSRLLSPVKEGLSKIRSRSPSRPVDHSASTTTSQFPQISALVPSSLSSDDDPNKGAPIAVSQKNSATSATQAPPATESTASGVSENSNPLHNKYTAITGLSTTSSGPLRLGQQMKEGGSTAYGGLTTIVQSLYDCSDMFLPLKTAAGLFLTIDKIIDRVSANREELAELEAKLAAILSIVEQYKEHGRIDTLHHRIETFCQAISLQVAAVQNLRDHPIWARTAQATKDAGRIAKAFRTMSILCDIFQMDTQLNIDKTVGDIGKTVNVIFQRLNSGTIDRLRHEMTSYKTRYSSYGDPSGCMAGTRVNILANLEAWASDENSSKVYWLVGMAGTGKSAISQTLCEILDEKNMLGASFFCSRASDKTSNARLIIPTIAHALAKASPSIKAKIIKMCT